VKSVDRDSVLNKIETQSIRDEPSQRRTGRRRVEVDACTEKAATLDPDVRRVLAQIPAGIEPIHTLMVLESYMTPALHSSLISDIERSREHVRHSPSSVALLKSILLEQAITLRPATSSYKNRPSYAYLHRHPPSSATASVYKQRRASPAYRLRHFFHAPSVSTLHASESGSLTSPQPHSSHCPCNTPSISTATQPYPTPAVARGPSVLRLNPHRSRHAARCLNQMQCLALGGEPVCDWRLVWYRQFQYDDTIAALSSSCLRLGK
jgi:hypothetical protein